MPKQTSPKRWFANANMMSYYYAINNMYPVAMTPNATAQY